MKVSIENNRRMQKAGITAVIVILIYAFSHVSNNLTLYYIVNIFIGVIYIVFLIYLISILQYIEESISVQNPFGIFLGLEIVRFFGQMLLYKNQSNLYTGIGTIELIIFFYILIASFKVKSKELSAPFRFLGITFLISSFIKLILLFSTSPRFGRYDNSLLLANILSALPFIAMFYIISEMSKILKTKSIPEIKSDI